MDEIKRNPDPLPLLNTKAFWKLAFQGNFVLFCNWTVHYTEVNWPSKIIIFTACMEMFLTNLGEMEHAL